MKKHFLPFLFLMFACAYSLASYATGEVYDEWDGTSKEAMSGPTIYTVTTAAELAWLADQDEDFEGATIILQANIDLKGQVWKPIGTSAKPFKGTFKGKGHLIKGLRLFNATDGVGLFGHVGNGAVIDSLGISGGNLVAKNKRRVGAIAGVCAGSINQCWSMAEIAVAGNVVGGLVGELKSPGTITDAYNAGLILNANDTIGGIVGRNYHGTLTRVFNTGYAKNGLGLVGDDIFSFYNDCYFDRKLYYQKSGLTNDPGTPIDVTADMFGLYAGSPAWDNANDRYPVLSAFKNTDAALLSAAPMLIEASSIDPVNHANDLTLDFTVSTRNGAITWTCEDQSAARWITINGSQVDVTRPCSETDVLVDKTMGSELHIVYMRPRRMDDLLAGTFISFDPDRQQADVILYFCYNGKNNAPLPTYSDMTEASRGWLGDGDYTYQVERWVIDDANLDTFVLDTLLRNANSDSYRTWYNHAEIKLNEPGHYIIRSFVKDNGCVNAWVENKTGVEYVVFEEFIPGKIESGTDTVILDNVPYLVSVNSLSASTGGEGDIVYWWMMNNDTIVQPSMTALNLVNYPINNPGTYIFTRGTKDENCYTPNFILDKLGADTVYAFLPLDPGEIKPTNDTSFCTVEDAKQYAITATAATGGITDKGYSYQWYLVNGTDSTAIAGATSRNLSLGNLTLAAGKDYTFVRKAWDNTKYTKWTVSRFQRTIHIMTALEPGAITDGALPDYCAPFDATNSTMITVNVAGTTPASGDAAGIMYRWICSNGTSDKVVGSSTPSLSYQVRLGDVLGKTLIFHREVKNPGCDWNRSAGTATQYFGQDTRAEVTFTICESELPYTYKWIDGTELKFYNDGDKRTVSDTWTNRCAKDTTFIVTVATRPNFSFNEDYVSWCQTTGTMAVYYNDDPAIPSNYFYIRYSEDLKNYMGKADTTGAITTPGMIQFDNMPSLGTGDLYLMVQIGYSANAGESTCFSSSRQLRLYPSLGGYLYSKYDRVVFVDNNPQNGALPETSEKLEFVSYQWYKNGIPQEGMTGQYYHENGAILDGVFYCMLKDTKDKTYRTCDITLPAEGASAAPQRCAVYPVPANAGETITIECTGSARIISFAGECVMQANNIDEKISVSAPRIPGMYYVEIRDTEGGLDIHKLIVK